MPRRDFEKQQHPRNSYKKTNQEKRLPAHPFDHITRGGIGEGARHGGEAGE